ncbi:nucleoporin Nup43-like [Lingula anatina]|uniref:Nucleoporin Nup43-like n=1 Tax=Lingula anatina TaxID=7574 RepID=A0A1S3IPH1_LINAN|nr:nucleoporin Nup43-like [Lingula anatina]|eukprot:XP_013399806.1 nucleoporin Nup43-like [Lingula anatina]
MAEVNAKFISQKISKIRWRPTSQKGLEQSDTFVTGSWDNGAANKVCLWTQAEGEKEQLNFSVSRQQPPESGPRLLCEVLHCGDVTDIQFFNHENILVASSTGQVNLYKHFKNSQTLGVAQSWHVHKNKQSPCPCTSVACRGQDVVTAGEDGRLNILAIGQQAPVRSIEKADSCSINGVNYYKHYEVITVNSSGQLKVYDLRQPEDEPSRIFLLTGERIPLHCVDTHPSQPHIVATGGQDGVLCIWDMRQEKFPVTLLDAHAADMWEVKFHPRYPDNLFTCSEDGTVWHWDVTSVSHTRTPAQSQGTPGSVQSRTVHHLPATTQPKPSGSNPWLTIDASKHRIEVTNLMHGSNFLPINTLDIESNTVICGGDSEAIYVIPNLVIR